MKYLDIKVFIKDNTLDEVIDDIAEEIKDTLFDHEGDGGPVQQVTFELIDDYPRLGDTMVKR